MNVVILGAGTVGTSLAEILCANKHDVRLVDSSREALDRTGDMLDVQTVCGSACDAITLFQADILSADLCLAVTSHDEINLVGASLAKAMGAKRTVARIFEPTYRDFSTFDYQRHFGIDRLLSLEHLTALELAKAIRDTGLFAIQNFARGGIEVLEVEVQMAAKSVGIALKDLELPKQVRMGLITRGEQAKIPSAEDIIQVDDLITLVGPRGEVDQVRKKFERKKPERRRVVIAGGGEVGFNLASALQGERFNVTIMESNQDRCQFLSERLSQSTVIHADVTRRSEMEEARVGKADVFVAATGRDEDNIVCGVEARELGAKIILGVVRRPDYANVLEKLGINVAVSPRQVMSRQILGMLTGGPILSSVEIGGGQAVCWEVEILKDAPITTAPLKEIVLPKALIAALVREDFAWVPGANDQLQAGDTVVVMLQTDIAEDILPLFEKPIS